VKDLWYHVRLIEHASPSVLEPLRAALHDLEDALGDDHDLSTLLTTVRELPEARDQSEEVELLELRAAEVSHALREAAFRLGERVYAERPKAFGRRMAGYLTVWRDDGPEVTVGTLERVAVSPATSSNGHRRRRLLIGGVAAAAVTAAATVTAVRKGHRG
jgi:hypothetical protein